MHGFLGHSLQWLLSIPLLGQSCLAKLSLYVLPVRSRASQVVLVVKTPPPRAGDTGDVVSIPGLGRSSGGGHGNPPQYSCLENPKDRGTLRAMVHRVEKVGYK